MSFLYFAFNYIYSGFYTEPWAVIFSDNAWQRQQNILKKQARQPACITRSFNSNSKSNSLCSWKFAFFRFQNIILSLLFFFLSWILAHLIIKVFIVFYFYATCLKDFISIQMLCSCTCKWVYLLANKKIYVTYTIICSYVHSSK